MEKTMIYICTEAGGSKRTIDLSPGINEQDLLVLLCWHYEEAARFVLDWASTDMDATVQFTAAFLAQVVNDLHIFSPNMPSKRPEKLGLQTPGTSVCSVAFQRFCELLHENRELVCLIREQPVYSTVDKKMDILGERASNLISLTRGMSWEASPAFKNPNPISRKTQEFFQQGLQEQYERDEAKRELEKKKRVREKEERTKERHRLAALKQKEIKKKSEQKKTLRNHFMSLSVDAQLRMLATETETPITVFPFDPRSITDGTLRRLDDITLTALVERTSKRREVWWKEFTAKSQRILQHRTTPPTE